MKNRILCALLALVFVLALLPSVALAEETTSIGSLSNFIEKNKFTNQTFTDVSTDDWFYTNVAYVYVYGLMVGTSDTTFNPKGNVKLSEAVTVAARLNMIYTTGAEIIADPAADSTGKWYDHYVDYAKENGIIESDYEDYEKAATRAEFASILAAALPDEALEETNVVVDNAIPDVSAAEDYAPAVYKLYRAGIIVGNNDEGIFNPDRNITRAEVSAIISRMISREQRKSVTLTKAIERIFDDDGNLKYECTTHYNEKGSIVSSHECFIDGTVIDTSYDDSLNPVKIVEKDENGKVVYKCTSHYNEYGLITSLHERYAGGDLRAIEYTYDESLNLVKEIEKDRNGDVTYEYTAVYNDDGLLVKIVVEGTLFKTSVLIEYNANNLPVKLTLTSEAQGGEFNAEYIVTYDGGGNATQVKATIENGKEKISTSYNKPEDIDNIIERFFSDIESLVR